MVSETSKLLPFLSIAVGLFLAIMTIYGYGEQIEHVLALLVPVLTITAGGGLINKAIEAGVEKKTALLDEGHLESLIKDLQAQLEKKKEEPPA